MVVFRKRLPFISGTNGACDIHSMLGDIMPERLAGFGKFLIPCFHSRICHTCVQIHCPDRMTHSLLLLPHRSRALCIFLIFWIRAPHSPSAFLLFPDVVITVNAPHINKVHCQFLVPFFTGTAVQPHKRKLNLRMSRIALRTVFYKPSVDVIGHTAHNL